MGEVYRARDSALKPATATRIEMQSIKEDKGILDVPFK
jgi:hypothetical protein